MAMKLSQSTFNFYYVYVRLWYAVSFYMLPEYFSIALGSLDDRGNFLICGIYADKEVVGKDATGRFGEPGAAGLLSREHQLWRLSPHFSSAKAVAYWPLA